MVLTGLALALTAGAGFAQDLGGTYRVEGRNPNGSAYGGSARLVDHGDAVSIDWNISGSGFSGYGTKEGRILTVDWGQATPVVYVYDPATGQLHGTWDQGRALDRLIPQ
ncbi:MAG: hypothetical protein GY952_15165 [Rhodobacteraceae bacterium]|nr:hypothetical protein [Paracoccaceae bacterium]